eukprot:3819894-Alexandrium_andersonii.AAC.1
MHGCTVTTEFASNADSIETHRGFSKNNDRQSTPYGRKVTRRAHVQPAFTQCPTGMQLSSN